MPNTARWAATLTLTATAVCGPLTGAALAAPEPAPSPSPSSSSLHAPSALVLTVGHGERATTAAPERAVTLTCAPTASGTHPAAAQACAELRMSGGDFDSLAGRGKGMCTREYRPVVVTVDGVWQGRRVSYERTFPNECVKNSYGMTVFAF
ncbi:protease inhibitor [Streptomyces sp. HC44]|uniref:Probable subtilase-type protease inhibitor n=1 Tax=Streptomyces scabichelini TaxID=2711217 RepID=A0A6G4UYE9_9ACTN|nr:protease inhibitor [Streptomyces scabichelini]NGO06781.1 protease inhibitor [Streptomyces scabichelini]